MYTRQQYMDVAFVRPDSGAAKQRALLQSILIWSNFLGWAPQSENEVKNCCASPSWLTSQKRSPARVTDWGLSPPTITQSGRTTDASELPRQTCLLNPHPPVALYPGRLLVQLFQVVNKM